MGKNMVGKNMPSVERVMCGKSPGSEAVGDFPMDIN
jgi:hypothetical protein